MKTELLAPAGSIEALHAALAAGADAVYIGGSRFGARAYADNPGEEELCEAIRLTHRLDKKLYMTVNTLLKDRELERELYEWMKPYVLAGLDGVIVQDFGVVDFFSRVFPELPLHASTQMAVTGVHSARLMKRLGFERIVPARELSLEEVRAIHADTGIEIEAFAHGAMCYSYSGMCLMSSMIGGRSGNRGRCAGVCRLPFGVYASDGRELTGGNSRYPLNMKDMCTLSILPQMMDAGILSYKIEGRMKKPEYTAGVVSIYRKYLDLAMQDPEHYRVDPADERYLWELFNRDGFHDGCYRERNGRSLIALQNEKLSDVRRDSAKELIEEIRRELNTKESRRRLQAGVTGRAVIRKGKPVQLTVSRKNRVQAMIEVGDVQQAQKQPLSEERIAAQLRKTGNDDFYFEDLLIEAEQDCFVPVQVLNEARRQAFELLNQNIEARFARQEVSDPWERGKLPEFLPTDHETDTAKHHARLRAEVQTEGQLKAVLEDERIAGIYADFELFLNPETASLLAEAVDHKREVRLMLPYILRENGLDRVRSGIRTYLAMICSAGREDGKFSASAKPANDPWNSEMRTADLPQYGTGKEAGILVRCLEELGLLHDLQLDELAVLDASVYTMNSRAERYWAQHGYPKNTVSQELNAAELRGRENANSELIIYGRVPMMISAHCLQKTLRSCSHSNENLSLVDRKHARFPVACKCSTCFNVIYNAVPLSLLGEREQIEELGCSAYRISLTTEDERTSREVVRAFADVFVSGTAAEVSFETTRGHFRRGVQ